MINNKNGSLIFVDTDRSTATELPEDQSTEHRPCTNSAGNTFFIYRLVFA